MRPTIGQYPQNIVAAVFSIKIFNVCRRSSCIRRRLKACRKKPHGGGELQPKCAEVARMDRNCLLSITAR